MADWHLDKKVPIAIILAILIQTGTIIWAAAQLENRVSNIENTITTQATHADRIARLEVSKEDVARRLDRIETKIDRILENWPER